MVATGGTELTVRDGQASSVQPVAPVQAAVAPAGAIGGWKGLAMVMTPAEQQRALADFQQYVKDCLEPGVDFGVIPGTERKSLWKPGAEKLAEIYRLRVQLLWDAIIEDWNAPFFYYRVRAVVRDEVGNFVGEGIGSCNSRESNYAVRWAWPNEVTDEQKQGLRSKTFRGRNGKTYTQYAVPNLDICSLVNTFQKMACKRAYVDAVLRVTRSSGMWTQDEDIQGDGVREDDDEAPTVEEYERELAKVKTVGDLRRLAAEMIQHYPKEHKAFERLNKAYTQAEERVRPSEDRKSPKEVPSSSVAQPGAAPAAATQISAAGPPPAAAAPAGSPRDFTLPFRKGPFVGRQLSSLTAEESRQVMTDYWASIQNEADDEAARRKLGWLDNVLKWAEHRGFNPESVAETRKKMAEGPQ